MYQLTQVRDMEKTFLQTNPNLNKKVQRISDATLLRMEKATSANALMKVYDNAVKKLPDNMAGKLEANKLHGYCLGLLTKKGWKKEAGKLVSNSFPSLMKSRIMK